MDGLGRKFGSLPSEKKERGTGWEGRFEAKTFDGKGKDWKEGNIFLRGRDGIL